MPSTTQGDLRLFGAGTDDAFQFSSDWLTAPVGMLTDGEELLPAHRLIAEMARLAEDAYDKTTKDAVGRGWDALTASELGLAEKGSGSVRYTFRDGVYQGDRSGSSEGQALVLSRTIDDELVLTIAFRGTVDLIDQYKDYFPFDRHYKTFKPLIKAVKEFVADAANGIDKVVVTGHSLGAAMAQLFLNEFWRCRFAATPSAVPVRTRRGRTRSSSTSPTKTTSFRNSPASRTTGRAARSPSTRTGSTGSAAHATEQYMTTTAFLSGEASDTDSPFHSHGLAKALRTGGNFVRDIRLEIGTNGSDTLKPFAEDQFSLAGDGDDRFKIRKDELVEKRDRDLDGGNGDDRVALPYNKTRKGDGAIFDVSERNDGGMALKYDVRDRIEGQVEDRRRLLPHRDDHLRQRQERAVRGSGHEDRDGGQGRSAFG